jgi:hypothetical protein
VPFASDRPLRDTIAEIAGKQVFAVMDIHKTASLGVLESDPTDFFTLFSVIAEKHTI